MLLGKLVTGDGSKQLHVRTGKQMSALFGSIRYRRFQRFLRPVWIRPRTGSRLAPHGRSMSTTGWGLLTLATDVR